MGSGGLPAERNEKISKLLDKEVIEEYNDDYESEDCRF